MSVVLKLLFVLLCLLNAAPSDAGSCRWVFREFEFSYHIRRGDADSAAAMLAAEKVKVSEEIADLSANDKLVLDFHWAGRLTGEAISTPMQKLIDIANAIGFKPRDVIVDIGSGHGDPGLVFSALHPEIRVHGFEIALPKVVGARRMAHRLGLYDVHFLHKDVSHLDFQLPVADYYYLFNPARIDVVEKMADQIRDIARTTEVKVIVVDAGWTPKIFADRGFVLSETQIEGVKVLTFKAQGRNPYSHIEQLVLDYNRARKMEEQLYYRYQSEQTTKATETQVFNQFIKAKNTLYEPIIRAIHETPAADRIAYLRGLNEFQFEKMFPLLDHIFGIRFAEANAQIDAKISTNGKIDHAKQNDLFGHEKIWFFPDSIGPQTDYGSLLRVLKEINPQPGQWVADLGSGFGRMGMLIGLLYPEVRFTGLEIVGERVEAANAAAKDNGFTNVEYHTENLADLSAPLPTADYFYMFNPTSIPTSNIVTQKLVNLSSTKDFQVVLLTTIASSDFYKVFHEVQGKRYLYKITPLSEELDPAAE